MNSIKTLTAAALTSLALLAAPSFAAPAATSTPTEQTAPAERGWHGKQHRMGRASLEGTLMHNALIDELATRTGRSADDVRSVLKEQRGAKGTQTLGLDKDAFRDAMKQARQNAITHAQTAGLVSTEQAEQLRSAATEKPLRARKGDKRGKRGAAEPTQAE